MHQSTSTDLSTAIEAARQSYMEKGFALLGRASSGLTDERLERLEQISAGQSFTNMRLYTNSNFSQTTFAGFDPCRHAPTGSADKPEILSHLLNSDTTSRIAAILGATGPIGCVSGVFNRYEPDQYMELHADQNPGQLGKAAMVVGLKDDFFGGDLLIVPKTRGHECGVLRIGRGDIALVEMGVQHAVMPVTTGLRVTASMILANREL